MKTTADFLDDLRAKLTLPSDGKLALAMGWQRPQLGRYRGKYETVSDETCLKVARVLEIEPDYIMACMALQRAKTPETRTAWKRIAARLAPAAAALLLAVGFGTPAPAEAAFDINILAHQGAPGPGPALIHICDKSSRRLTRRALARLSAWWQALGIPPFLAAPGAL